MGIKKERGRTMTFTERMSHRCYRIIRWLIWKFYPRTTIEGTENLPESPCVIVSNHAQLHGPIICELYLPGDHDTWCAGQMMQLKEVPTYAFEDFWRDKPGYCRCFFKLASYVIAPLSVCIFNNARTIGVYHDARIMSTFRTTLARLEQGAHVVIMPEGREGHNAIVNDLQDGFIDIARLYQKRTGKALNFVPMYIAPALHKAVIGTPIHCDMTQPWPEAKAHLKQDLLNAITDLAQAQPAHRVTPYTNMPKKDYPLNQPTVNHER